MKTAIVYYSEHHGNTKKLLDAIAKQADITLIKASDKQQTDLTAYDVIGFASGIYFQKFHETVLQFANKNLPQGKKVFLIYTCGLKRNSYTNAMKKMIDSKGAQMLGTYACPGFDTYGPFKLVGGIAKGRPDDRDMTNAVKFFKELSGKLY